MSNSADQKTYGLFSTATNRKLARKLESGGAKIFQFPPIETEKISLQKTSINYLQNLTDFDWLIFPDIVAVDYFLQALEALGVDFFELDAVNVCALGESVADSLRFVQLHADLIPHLIETEPVFATIKSYVGENGFKNLKFLLPKEVDAEIELIKKLTEKSAIVTELPIYQAKLSDNSEISKLKVLLTGGAIDTFIFSAPTDIISLKYLFPHDPMSTILAELEVSATDEVMFQALKENNIKSKIRRIIQ